MTFLANLKLLFRRTLHLDETAAKSVQDVRLGFRTGWMCRATELLN